MPSLWSWTSSVCRQKRILILLCTFGSSFIAFNYSLLSSSTTTTNPTLNSFSTGKIDDGVSFTGKQSKKYEEFVITQKQGDQQQSTILSLKVPVSSSSLSSSSAVALSRLKTISNVAKNDSISSSSYNEPSTFTSYFNASPISSVSQSQESSPVSKHAQKSFASEHRKATYNQLVTIDDRSRLTNKIRNRVNFLSAIEQNDDNNNISMSSSNFRIENNRISTSFHFSKTNLVKPFDYDNNNVKTDEIRQPTVTSSFITPSEIIESSIIISSSSNGKNEHINNNVVTPDFPMLSNSIQSPLIQPSSSKLFSSVTTASPPVESSSPQPNQLQSFHTNRDGGGGSSNSSISNNNSNQQFSLTLSISSSSKSNLLFPFHIPPCNTTFQLRRIQKRKKNLTVIENFIMAWKHVKCNETITYTTHGDYRYLDNLVALVDRWNGPVSLAIYCPGEDLDETLKLISYLKLCTTSNIDKWVTFHLIYDTRYMKRPVKNFTKHGDIPWLDTLYQEGTWKNCSHKPTFSKSNYTFRIQNGLLYPINIARNIARAAATTYFVLASDIELYPSINLIPSFMEMLGRLQKEEKEKNNYTKKNIKFTAAAAAVMAKFFPGSSTTAVGNQSDDGGGRDEIPEQRLQDSVLKEHQNELQQEQQHQQRLSDHRHQQNRHVFVLPVFEVKKDIVPCQVETKEQLASLLKFRAAVLFHHSICPQCHTFPKYEDWKVLYPNSSDGVMKDYRKYNCSSNSTNKNSNGSNNSVSSSANFMRIFHKGKRKHPFQLWEPIFIGTKEEPIYDERLSWEGLRDKMVSGYIMCALDYDFYILDNAFLVHKPGIRKVNHLVTKTVMSQDRLINYRIRSELLKKFGKHDECAL